MATKVALKNAAGQELAPRTDYSVLTNSPLLNYASKPVFSDPEYISGLTANPSQWGNGLFMICVKISDNGDYYCQLPLLINTSNSNLREFTTTAMIPASTIGSFYTIKYVYSLDTNNFSGTITKWSAATPSSSDPKGNGSLYVYKILDQSKLV